MRLENLVVQAETEQGLFIKNVRLNEEIPAWLTHSQYATAYSQLELYIQILEKLVAESFIEDIPEVSVRDVERLRDEIIVIAKENGQPGQFHLLVPLVNMNPAQLGRIAFEIRKAIDSFRCHEKNE
jgi:hypothetical protein